jgi:hypothetical protein
MDLGEPGTGMESSINQPACLLLATNTIRCYARFGKQDKAALRSHVGVQCIISYACTPSSPLYHYCPPTPKHWANRDEMGCTCTYHCTKGCWMTHSKPNQTMVVITSSQAQLTQRGRPARWRMNWLGPTTYIHPSQERGRRKPAQSAHLATGVPAHSPTIGKRGAKLH